MASKQTYECFVCKKAGFTDVRVYLNGKTEDGKTFYKNTDMSPHQHHKQQQQQQPSTGFHVSRESVDRGITAFSLMTALIKLVEQNKNEIVTLNEKLDRLLNLAEQLLNRK